MGLMVKYINKGYGNDLEQQRAQRQSDGVRLAGNSSAATSRERHDIRRLDVFSYPFLLALATLGNTLNIIILKREKPCTSKNVYLIAIAASDMIFKWSALMFYIINFDGEVHGMPRPHLYAAVRPIQGFGAFCQETAAVFSSWVIVAFSVERFIAIKYPLRHMIKDNLRQSRVNIGAILFSAVLLVIHRLVDYYHYYVRYGGTNAPHRRTTILLSWNLIYTWLIVRI
ncbi:uncharacterized protein LOC129590904 [Paramacrobiotus metropolitanus]|uniref:uncharacterized protein LOC129590904 n=1 Tax=Paramacrobiotus metropolitanus TaxID=2943436 RepID=UPI002445A5D3|nr:uncharacterized protein LOC129590904 [Paramacrobiotus metropolitanus]